MGTCMVAVAINRPNYKVEGLGCVLVAHSLSNSQQLKGRSIVGWVLSSFFLCSIRSPSFQELELEAPFHGKSVDPDSHTEQLNKVNEKKTGVKTNNCSMNVVRYTFKN